MKVQHLSMEVQEDAPGEKCQITHNHDQDNIASKYSCYKLKNLEIHLSDIQQECSSLQHNEKVVIPKDEGARSTETQNTSTFSFQPYPVQLFQNDSKVNLSVDINEKNNVCSYCGESFVTIFDLGVHKLKHIRPEEGDTYIQLDGQTDWDTLDLQNPHRQNISFENERIPKDHTDIDPAILTDLSESTRRLIKRVTKKPGCEVIPPPSNKLPSKSIVRLGVQTVRRLHHEKIDFHCAYCDKDVSDLRDLSQHLAENEEQIACVICSEAFSNECSFHTHYKLHSKYQQSMCEMCHIVFPRAEALEEHKKVHDDEYMENLIYVLKSDNLQGATNQSSKCEEGNFRVIFPKDDNCLQEDIATQSKDHNTEDRIEPSLYEITPDLPHIVSNKGSEGTQQQNGVLGEEIEMEVDHVYSCSLCDKDFPSEYALSVHFRLHTGEKPYKCEFCQRCFLQRNTYLIHKRTHRIMEAPKEPPRAVSSTSHYTTSNLTAAIPHNNYIPRTERVVIPQNNYIPPIERVAIPQNNCIPRIERVEGNYNRAEPTSHTPYSPDFGGYVTRVNLLTNCYVCPVCRKAFKNLDAKKKKVPTATLR